MTKREQLIAWLKDPAKRLAYYTAGHAAVPGGHNACAATASQPHMELGELKHPVWLAENLATILKGLHTYSTSSNRSDVEEGDLIVCTDLNGNGLSDHVWHVVSVIGDGEYACFDNQCPGGIPYARRVDGKDGKTAMRDRLRLLI